MISNSNDEHFFLIYSPNTLCLCSHLDLIVKNEIIDEEASESRRDDHHQTRTQYTSPYLNINSVQ